MVQYSFFPHTARGATLMFEIDELADDEVAYARAAAILRDHGSARKVEVWRDDRVAFVVRLPEPRSWVEDPAGPTQP